MLGILSFAPNSILAQGEADLPSSTIYFVRGSNFFGSGCRTDITLPNQRQFNLSWKSIVKYKVYSEGEINITLEIICTSQSGSSTGTMQVALDVKRGKEYYILYTASKFKAVEKAEVQKELDEFKNVMKQEENLDFPINKNSVKNIAEKDGKGQGSCFLISSEGYLITNYHCIENAKEIMIKGIDGDFSTKYGATVVASDQSNDLAILKLSNKNLKFKNPPFAIRSSGVAQAEKVYALGFPAASAMGQEMKITEGIISAKSGVQGDISKFQISAAVNPGNSGGPLIDEKGNLIGVIYAKSTIAEAAGYAIKASYLETFLKNVDEFNYPILVNQVMDKPLAEKVSELKNFVFIIETN
jgi:S1-C subfamily serine protease